MEAYSIGLDYGSEEVRAVLCDMQGHVIAKAGFLYPHGVITNRLPDGTPIGAEYVLHDPRDYVEGLHYLMRELFQGREELRKCVKGIGLDITECTMVPLDKAGEPLCFSKEYESDPDAYIKLWKHHGAQEQADRLTEVAKERNEAFLPYYGERIFCETMFPKMLEIYEKARHIYDAADAFVEMADWLTFYLTGSKTCGMGNAGCTMLFSKEEGYPSANYLENVSAGFSGVVEKLSDDLVPVGTSVGTLKKELCEAFGLPENVRVAPGMGDCQAAIAGAGVYEAGKLLCVMGTSSCDLMVYPEKKPIPGLYGIASDNIIPGMVGYEAGQSTFGDLFKWFKNHWIPQSYTEASVKRGETVFDYLNSLIADRDPSQIDILALDWWNGNRSVLLDSDLSGMVVGMHAGTSCEDIYLALMEALAFGKRRIVEQFKNAGIEVDRLYATGGVPTKNPPFMQILADVCDMPVHVLEEENCSCLGSAVYGAFAGAGGMFPTLQDAIRAIGSRVNRIYEPRAQYTAGLMELYEDYKRLHDYFGLENKVMRRLRDRRGRV